MRLNAITLRRSKMLGNADWAAAAPLDYSLVSVLADGAILNPHVGRMVSLTVKRLP